MCRSDHYLDEEPRYKRYHQPGAQSAYFDSEHFENFAFEPLKFDAPYSHGGPSYEIPVLSLDHYEPPRAPLPHPTYEQPSRYQEPYAPSYPAQAPADLPPPNDYGRTQFPFLAAQAPSAVAYGGQVGSSSYSPPPPPPFGGGPAVIPHGTAAAAAVVQNSNQFVNVEAPDTWESGHVRGSPAHSRQEYSRREGRTFKQQVRHADGQHGEGHIP